MRLSLGKCAWKIMGMWPYAPCLGQSVETGGELQGVTDWIDARVPGCVQKDLLRAGVIDDPYFEKNSLLCEWVEHRWWQYRAFFTVPQDAPRARRTLRFLGVDYAARFYLNGVLLGRHEGMYDAAAFDVTGLLSDTEPNRVDVLLESAPEEFGQLGHTSGTDTQKARFNYKWDFGTRLVHLGLWKDVEILATGTARVKDLRVTTDVAEDGAGLVRARGVIEGMRPGVYATLSLDGRTRRLTPHPFTGAFDETVRVPEPRLWQTNGRGAQPLYDISVLAFDENGESDAISLRAGIRSLRYRRADGADDTALKYLPVVNGRDVYIKGVNMTPLDHMYGALTREDYLRTLSLARDAGVNLIRVWGGGLIETEDFYDLCDEMGILVWQEFIQSSSGVDNIPSKKPHFLALLRVAATAALQEKRNHACLAFWSGGNELTDARGVPATCGDENIAMLAQLCREMNPETLFLPTSASGPSEWLLPDRPGSNHDVHGNWQYEGVRAHYERFNASDSMLHSEFGTDGLSSPESLARILSSARLRPVSMREDAVWRHHGEWWDVYARDTALFGDLPDVRKWALLSQYIQAESLRYALEANRRRAFANVGSIIWQLNEPWPNASGTCLVEYSGAPKLAWYAMRKAFAPRHVSLRYDGLVCKASEPFACSVWAHNSLAPVRLSATVRVLSCEGVEYLRRDFAFDAPDNAAVPLGEISCRVPASPDGLFLVETTLRQDGALLEATRILFSQKEDVPFAGLLRRRAARLSVTPAEGGVTVRNEGDETAFLVRCASGALPEDDGLILFPGEARALRVQGKTPLTATCLNAED